MSQSGGSGGGGVAGGGGGPPGGGGGGGGDDGGGGYGRRFAPFARGGASGPLLNHEAQAWRAQRGTACNEPWKRQSAKIEPWRRQNAEFKPRNRRNAKTAKINPKSKTRAAAEASKTIIHDGSDVETIFKALLIVF